MNDAHKPRVAVLMGGIGGEREVSLKSGQAVAAGLREVGYPVVPYQVTDPALSGLQALSPALAFIALHGRFGEDGTVQRILEDMGIPYTGSGPEASRTGMDKLASKRAFVRESVPTPDYFAIGPEHSLRLCRAQAERLGLPLVCKPACSGSSLGISIVRKVGALADSVELSRRESETVLLERYVRGREFTVGVLDGEALPMVELQVAGDFFDFDAKYKDPRTHYITQVSLLPTLYRKACRIAERAYQCIGCRHVARVDLMYGFDGRLYVLEVNTIPGLTPRSLLPMAAARAGISFPELCHRTVQAALRDARSDATRRRMTG